MIYDSIWNESDAVGTGTTIAPWQLFLNTTSIKNKIQNYLYMRGKLHLKIVINASPFYYGSLLINYIPLNGFYSPPIVNDTINSILLPRSQMPHIWIYPQTNQGGEIVCPFMLHKPWLDITSNTQVTNMGSLSWTVANVLQSANGITGVGVYFSIYAWMEDVEFLGTTSKAALQSEWATGPISKPASALSKALSSLSNIPVIGNYAAATSMITEGVGRLASNLGYSNPPVIENQHGFKPQPYPQLAATEISTPVERLSVDPKNEVSIDPAIFGMPQNDELDISYIVKRESYLTSCTFDTANAVNAIIFRCNVMPSLVSSDYGANSFLNFTPMGYLATMFQFWRGDIIFRFKIVCTQYHKGRLLLLYDPLNSVNNILSASTDSSTVFTQVIDIGKDNDVEFRVPYMQALPWLQTAVAQTGLMFNNGSSAPNDPGPEITNGTIALRVLNPLTAPVAVSNIKIQVFVRGADNLEFAAPRQLQKYTPYALQTEDVVDFETPPEISVAEKKGYDNPSRYLITMGEKITSLRQLLRRDTFVSALNIISEASGTVWMTNASYYHGRFPRIYGYDTNGVSSAKGTLVPASNFNFNYVFNDYYSFLSLMYIGSRGSVNWTYQADNGTNIIPDIRAYRFPGTSHATPMFVTSTASFATASQYPYQSITNTAYYPTGGAGMSITNQQTQAGVSINVPWYSRYLFYFNDPATRTNGSSQDGSNVDTIVCNINIKPVVNNVPMRALTLSQHFSIGPDFTFCYFLCCPSLYLLTTVPVNN